MNSDEFGEPMAKAMINVFIVMIPDSGYCPIFMNVPRTSHNLAFPQVTVE